MHLAFIVHKYTCGIWPITDRQRGMFEGLKFAQLKYSKHFPRMLRNLCRLRSSLASVVHKLDSYSLYYC